MHHRVVVFFVLITLVNYQLCCLDPVHNASADNFRRRGLAVQKKQMMSKYVADLIDYPGNGNWQSHHAILSLHSASYSSKLYIFLRLAPVSSLFACILQQ